MAWVVLTPRLVLRDLASALALGVPLATMPAGCSSDEPQRMAEPMAQHAAKHGVRIVNTENLHSVPSGQVDALGRPIRVACVSCHSQLSARPMPKNPQDLDEFHTGLTFLHGSLACNDCHVEREPLRLRLANNDTIPTAHALELCAQCHGPQYRDYEGGSHGGMNGSWDLTRGSRLRNHCVDCHDPHAPQYTPMLPVPFPSEQAR